MRTLALGAGLTITGLVLAGCNAATPAGSTPAANDEPKTLTIAIQTWMGDKLALKDMAAAYEAANDGVTVEIVEYADNQALSTFALQWSQGKADQDIVVVDGASTAVQFVQQGLIVDFNETDLFSGDLATDEFVGESLSFTQVDGNQFAVPLGLEVYNISANKEILATAGLLGTNGELPTFDSWDDVYGAAASITAATGQPGMTIQWGPNAVPTLSLIHI